MARRVRLGVEISPAGVRGVALSVARVPRIVARAERSVAGIHEVPQRLSEIIDDLGCRGPCRLLLVGAEVETLQVTVGGASAARDAEAIRRSVAARLGPRAESSLVAAAPVPGRDDARIVLCLSREPTETWAGLLTASGCPVEAIETRESIIHDHLGRRGGEADLIWAALGSPATAIYVARPGGITLAHEVAGQALRREDPVAVVEKRLAVFQEIERVLLDDRAAHGGRPVSRVVLDGAGEETSALRDQLAPALEHLGTRVELDDPWEGVARDPAEDPLLLARLAPALRAARGRASALAITTPAASRERTRRRRSWLSLVASAALALAAFAFALLAEARDPGAFERRRALEQTIAELSRARDEAARETSVDIRVEPLPVADWSDLLREVGRLARPGLDYRRLVLVTGGEWPTVGIEGLAEDRSTEASLLLIALHEALLSSPFGSGLPRLAAGDDGPGTRAPMRFAVEGAVREDVGEEVGP